MKLKIGNNYYIASPSFMTLVNYRNEYGKSFLEEQDTKIEILAQLIFVAIDGEKPYFHVFLNECRADSFFEATALHFYKDLLKHDEKEKKKDTPGEEINEYKILALCAIANISDSLLYKLNIFQLTSVINFYCDIKNDKQQPKLMSSDERKNIYKITPEKEEEIQNYLRNGGEE